MGSFFNKNGLGVNYKKGIKNRNLKVSIPSLVYLSSLRNSQCTIMGYVLQHKIILCIPNFVFWQQFCPFLFQQDNAPVHKARSIKKCFSQFDVEELD